MHTHLPTAFLKTKPDWQDVFLHIRQGTWDLIRSTNYKTLNQHEQKLLSFKEYSRQNVLASWVAWALGLKSLYELKSTPRSSNMATLRHNEIQLWSRHFPSKCSSTLHDVVYKFIKWQKTSIQKFIAVCLPFHNSSIGSKI